MNVPKTEVVDFGSNCRLGVCFLRLICYWFYVYPSLIFSAYYRSWISLLVWLLSSFLFIYIYIYFSFCLFVSVYVYALCDFVCKGLLLPFVLGFCLVFCLVFHFGLFVFFFLYF